MKNFAERKRRFQNTELMIIWLLAGLCQAPKILIATKITSKLTTNSAALSIRAGCVFGSIYSQTAAQIAAIRHIRRTNNAMLPTILKLYPILTPVVKGKRPSLTKNGFIQ
ncbi:MAG: hypothetical protein MUO27_09540 [Sedimentisphaerales bacterium]|nr:hypothetical protein [Sedimentisphaerales bacterium]